jgi:tRNA-uridine 2-sulfurtransferase
MTFPLPVCDALRAALPRGGRVLLGLSGGVDSSVALALLQHLGCEVHTVTLKNFCTSDGAFGGEGNRSCCSLDAIDAARRTAASRGARHWVSSVESEFRARVIGPFVDEYLSGRTPNPCVGCNSGVRFPQLTHLADELGCDLVATGHYARVLDGPGGPALHRGLDPDKDQSYFLHRLDRDLLARCVFPLGWSTKAEVRAAAAALGLEAAARPDSQEICFVPDDDRGFLFAGRETGGGGEIVHRDGRVLGRHRGLAYYTVGQRRGLGIAGAEPLFVTALDAARNRVVVGPRGALRVARIRCDGFADQSGVPDRGPPDDGPPQDDPPNGVSWTVQLRHRHAGSPVRAWTRAGARFEVELDGAAEGVAPGQFLVLYRGDRVCGGGRIVGTAPAGEEIAS